MSRTRVFTGARIYFIKRSICGFVRQPSISEAPASAAPLIIRYRLNLSTYFFNLFFWHCQAGSVPYVNTPIFTTTQAGTMPSKFPPHNTYLRHSQQVSQNAGKHPDSTFLLRLRNSTATSNTIATDSALLRLHHTLSCHTHSQRHSRSGHTIYNDTHSQRQRDT